MLRNTKTKTPNPSLALQKHSNPKAQKTYTKDKSPLDKANWDRTNDSPQAKLKTD